MILTVGLIEVTSVGVVPVSVGLLLLLVVATISVDNCGDIFCNWVKKSAGRAWGVYENVCNKIDS